MYLTTSYPKSWYKTAAQAISESVERGKAVRIVLTEETEADLFASCEDWSFEDDEFHFSGTDEAGRGWRVWAG